MLHESFQSGSYKIIDCKTNDAKITCKGKCLIHYTHEIFRFTLSPFLVCCNKLCTVLNICNLQMYYNEQDKEVKFINSKVLLGLMNVE